MGLNQYLTYVKQKKVFTLKPNNNSTLQRIGIKIAVTALHFCMTMLQ